MARALDVLGQRWTLLIVRDLLLGPRRYSDLLSALPGITTNLLAARLRHLTAQALVCRRVLPPPASSTVYELTESGRALRPVVLELGRFGAQYLDRPRPDDRVDPRWAMVSLMRRYRGCARPWTLQLRIDSAAYVARMTPEELHMLDGDVPEADGELRGSARSWRALLMEGASARELVARGKLERAGSARAIHDFARSIGARP